MPHTFASSLGVAGLLAALAGPALAQAPTLTASQPGRHAPSASRTGAVQLTFSQAVTGTSGIRVHGNRWRGNRAGTASGDGTPTLTMQPARAFAPGEEVSVSVPASVRGAGTGGQVLGNGGQVVQFRAAAGPATGSFTSGAAISSSSNYLYDMQLADVNNDGRLDLLQQDNLNNTALLRLGNGQGGLDAASTVSTDAGQYSLVLADFNNDGNLDLASTGAGGAQPYRNVRVQLGNGTGGLGALNTLGTQNQQQPLYLQAADVNADGNQDLVFIHYTPAFGSSTVAAELRVLLGNGQGGFTNQPALTLPGGYGGLRVTDVNNDGRLDCLVLTTSTGRLGFYQGDGQGGFALAAAPALTLAAQPGSTGLPAGYSFLEEVADFTGDGQVDVLLRDPGTSVLGLYAGNGQGTFGTPGPLAATNIQRVRVGDVEGDGDLDVVIVSLDRTSTTNFAVTPWLNSGSGTFTAGTPFSQYAQSVALGDLNNDGTTDLLVYNDALGGPTTAAMLYPRLGQPLGTAPTITQTTANASSTSITVTGTNLGTATTVLVGGQSVPFTINNGVLTVTLPAGSSGYVTVITPTGTATSSTSVSGTLAGRAAMAGSLAVELYPVPAHDAVQLRLPVAATAQVSLYDALGRLACSATLAAPAGQPVSLPLTNLAPGLYTLRLTAGPDVAVRQLLVE